MIRPYYERDGVTIYHGDCLAILPALEPVDHIITDPPFEEEAHTLQRRVKRNGGVMVVEPLPFAPMDEAMRDAVARECARLARRWVLAFCQIEAAPEWCRAFTQYGLAYRRTCLWIKPDGMPQYSGDRPGMGYETLIAMHAPGASRWNCGGRHGVWIIPKGEGAGTQPHPTTKPLRLMTALVAAFTDCGETILDPFCGSGTTLEAARLLGRRAIGIECEEKWCEAAVQRLAQGVLPVVSNSS